MERVVWVITHSDLDGMAAGAVVRQHYPHCNVMITSYNKKRFYGKIKYQDIVFITDFSLNLDEFFCLKQKGAEIIWIDHHRDNYEALLKQGWDCAGIRRDDYCGAALTWMYFNPNTPVEAMPEALKMVNDYDLWKFTDIRSKDFAYGAGLYDTRPGSASGDEFWRYMLADDKERLGLILKFGNHVRKYVEMAQDTYCADCAYYTTIPSPQGPKNILAMTVRAGNSSVFDRMDKSKLDATFTAQYVANIGLYRCSMYSPDNVKNIIPLVKMLDRDGGGHPGAAGFSGINYPLPLPALKSPRPIDEVVAMYDKLVTMRRESVVLKQWFDRSASITVRASFFHSEVAGLESVCVNYQFLPDLLPVISTNTQAINQSKSIPIRSYFGWVMTNTGWIRCCMYPADSSITVDQIAEAVKKEYPEAEATLTKTYGGVWWYTRDLPVRPPIDPNRLQSQARM